ncbi:phospholipid-binding protein MlaC [Paenalcaligenes sp.]|uniref:MlaC/ttg2D family ABC transporter substrate-binding protein n=1 Tax=Paenalcaligenes sp. TaxID=1966342 RepID=UPI0021B0A5CE|nr:ABC transporter substrate-binding protein [Paenalcaligenes sp.]
MLFVKRLFSTFILTLPFLLGSLTAHAKMVDAKLPPAEFIQAVADQTLEVVKQDKAAQAGDRQAINRLVDQYVLPYVNFEKTTRLAAGRHWRQASPEQRQQLVDAFKNTLIRTYSGALANVDQLSAIKVGPFRGDPNAADVVVRSTISQSNGPDVGVDYRMENTPEGWKIYDLNVEGIWLIQNYRNQFSQVVTEKGVDGLIQTLNTQSMPAQNP